uniref:Uncharacterized protein n=1 Tax=Astatotilapia calliptera TaxID=8154 RepID=A0A3P8PPR6_ASTCA
LVTSTSPHHLLQHRCRQVLQPSRCRHPRLVLPPCLHPRLVLPPCLHPRLVRPPCLHPRLVRPPCLQPRLVRPPCLQPRLVRPPCLQPRLVRPPCLQPRLVRPPLQLYPTCVCPWCSVHIPVLCCKSVCFLLYFEGSCSRFPVLF